jgi:hypothetical protein
MMDGARFDEKRWRLMLSYPWLRILASFCCRKIASESKEFVNRSYITHLEVQTLNLDNMAIASGVFCGEP